MATSKIKRGLSLKEIPNNLFTYTSGNSLHACSASDLNTALGDFTPIAYIVQSTSSGIIWGVTLNPSSSSNRLTVQGWDGKNAVTIPNAVFRVFALGY